MLPHEIFSCYSDAVESHDLDVIADLLHDEFRFEGAGLEGLDKSGFLDVMQAELVAFPDLSENPTDVSEKGNRVSFVAHLTGTHKGLLALPGHPPVEATGRTIQLPPQPAWIEIQNSKIFRYHVDPVAGGGVPGFLAQLGVAPAN